MKKEDGASNFFSNFNDRLDQSGLDKNLILPNTSQGFGNETLPNKFEGFGNETLPNKFEGFDNNKAQTPINPLTGVAQQGTNDIPMTNGTGSARPNFDEEATMSIKKVNEGAPMSNVLFKKK